MAQKHISNSPRIEAQYGTLFNLINNFEGSGNNPNPTAEYLLHYIRTHPELNIKGPQDKLINAKVWGFIEEKDGMTYLTNKAHDYMKQRDENDLTDLFNS
tara:strand:+ start:459 stop:758 length:300 start_codon:yes stop_codon:yes gene_type:complete